MMVQEDVAAREAAADELALGGRSTQRVSATLRRGIRFICAQQDVSSRVSGRRFWRTAMPM